MFLLTSSIQCRLPNIYIRLHCTSSLFCCTLSSSFTSSLLLSLSSFLACEPPLANWSPSGHRDQGTFGCCPSQWTSHVHRFSYAGTFGAGTILMPNFPVRHGALRDLCASKKVQYSTRTTMAEIWLRTSSSYAKESNEREIPKDAALSKHDFPGAASLWFLDWPDLHRLPDGQKSTSDWWEKASFQRSVTGSWTNNHLITSAEPNR